MARPRISVIVPFVGSPQALTRLLEDLRRVAVRPGDEIIVAHNRMPSGAESRRGGILVLGAAGVRAPAYARNRAAQLAGGEWLVFIDADTVPGPSLLDDLFDPGPASDTAILAGGIDDLGEAGSIVSRHAVARAHMSQTPLLTRPVLPYAQTANCAVRAAAFAAIGGFDITARAGEDADLCFRLQKSGWRLEARPRARVAHRGRTRLRGALAQLAVHGAGAAWVNRRHPGSLPAPSAPALARRLLRHGLDAARAATRGDHEAAAFALLDLSSALAFELGRRWPNRPRREPVLPWPSTGRSRGRMP